MIIIEHTYEKKNCYEEKTEFRVFRDNDVIGVQQYLDSIKNKLRQVY